MVVRASALLGVLGGLAAYYAARESLPDIPLWWEVAVIGLAVMPAAFACVRLALPLASSPLLAYAVAALVSLTALFHVAELDVAANFLKFAAVMSLGWLFLGLFEEASWVLLIALVIVPVDIFSVVRGPTKHIVEKQHELFNFFSVSFPVPGERTSAQLGLPDILFFALFLGAAERFRLRRELTWLLMTLSFAGTLAGTVRLDVSGLPALPLLSAGFVLANGDLLWRAVWARRAT